MSGEHVFGRPDLETVIEGRAQLRRGDTLIAADRLEYDQPNDLATARGHVHLNRAGNVFEGPLLELKLDSFEGFFNEPHYHFLRNDAYGTQAGSTSSTTSVPSSTTRPTPPASAIPARAGCPTGFCVPPASASTRKRKPGRRPMRVLSFIGVPILPIPSLSFPLSDKRKSGVLPPTIGLDNLNGVEVTLPYYWNIAPNRDATFYPTIMSKRGVDLGGEFRYLERDYSGQVRGDYMPSDQLRTCVALGLLGAARRHDHGAADRRRSALNLNLNRVSDDNYWRDFSRGTTSLTQRLLANDGALSWSHGDFSVSARALKWQTLQDVNAPIVPPYDRLPQVAARYPRSNLPGGRGSIGRCGLTPASRPTGD